MMAKIRPAKILFLISIFTLILTSCERKSCNSVVCPLGQICLNGNCICPNGYEGTDCQTLSADKYVGNYIVYESCPGSTTGNPFGQYNTYIGYDPSYPNQLIIYNLFNQGSAYASIYTDGSNQGNTLIVKTQNLGSITVYGDGNYDPSTRRITMTFDYTFNFNNYQCIHTFYKQ
ncbi:MAG: hypothetical protein IPP77_15150 [Bacteroidetes bacterium]|nr:hypothetical protein [Bacteroidota bacterium]